MNIVFDTMKYIVRFSSDYSHSDGISALEWINADVRTAIALNSTDSIIENALLTYNAFGANAIMPLLFKTIDDGSLHEMSNTKVIYGHSVPESMSGIDFISKDTELSYSIMSDHGQLSVIGHDFEVEYETTLNYNAQDISLV